MERRNDVANRLKKRLDERRQESAEKKAWEDATLLMEAIQQFHNSAHLEAEKQTAAKEGSASAVSIKPEQKGEKSAGKERERLDTTKNKSIVDSCSSSCMKN